MFRAQLNQSIECRKGDFGPKKIHDKKIKSYISRYKMKAIKYNKPKNANSIFFNDDIFTRQVHKSGHVCYNCYNWIITPAYDHLCDHDGRISSWTNLQ